MSIFENNLALIERTSPETARRIRAATPRVGLEWIETDEGSSAVLDGRSLASRRRPVTEAERQGETIDLDNCAAVVVMGFGLGHQAAAVARRMKLSGVVVAFEPDVSLLRSVFERIDCTGWISQTNFVLLTQPDDSTAVTNAIRGVEGLLAIGVKFLEPPVSRVRVGPQIERFGETFATVMRSVRSVILTTLMQVETTLRNLFQNADRYAGGDGISPLAGAAAGKPAIVVSAGPSLERNIALLARPEVRERYVIIAVQTALRPLLAAGVKPHFVTALDYHEISKRFYEGLTAADVAGVTLVAEPKANPAILESFPGQIRCVGNEVLDALLGPDLAPDRHDNRAIEPGATVAHLAYYLARRLGCDPVILTGQDLGFTDGQYYAAGAAIHDVWSSELNAFRTLEMLEWERIVRQRVHLHRTTDVLGRPVYTDEQMSSYLLQFERDFLADAHKGLRTIDATEGGVRKQHTETSTLADAIEQYAGEPLTLPETPAEDPGARAKALARVREVRKGVWRVGELSRGARILLEEMLERQPDQPHVNRLIEQVNKLRDEVLGLDPAWELVQHLNQTGTLNRFKADRAIGLDESLDGMERQKRQIERDITNVTWTADAAEQLGTMLDECARTLDGGERLTRDPAPSPELQKQLDESDPRSRRVGAIITVDPARGALGVERDLSYPLLAGLNSFQHTLRRLARAKNLDEIVLLAEDPRLARAIAGDVFDPARMSVIATGTTPLGDRAPAIASARRFAPACWRGGIANLSVFDEAYAPEPVAQAMNERNLDAAVLVGADWALIDPALVDEVVQRHRAHPKRNALVFTQAAPGLGCCLIDRQLAIDLARQTDRAGPFASIGGILGYVPAMPQSDPIARSWCVTTSPAVRDLALRCIPDTRATRAALVRTFDELGESVLGLDADAIAARLDPDAFADAGPQQVVLELCTGRRVGVDTPRERPVLSLDSATRVIESLAAARDDVALTLGGAGDPLLHPHWFEVVRTARDAGIAVHLRTNLLVEPADLERIIASGVDVVSIDLLASARETYRELTGVDRYDAAHAMTSALLDLRRGRVGDGGLPTPWVVPRITRRDAVYEQIEPFYDRWIMTAGAAAIDPLPVPDGGRIRPLPLPAAAAARARRERMTVLSDGSVPLDADDLAGVISAGSVLDTPLDELWRALRSGETIAVFGAAA